MQCRPHRCPSCKGIPGQLGTTSWAAPRGPSQQLPAPALRRLRVPASVCVCLAFPARFHANEGRQREPAAAPHSWLHGPKSSWEHSHSRLAAAGPFAALRCRILLSGHLECWRGSCVGVQKQLESLLCLPRKVGRKNDHPEIEKACEHRKYEMPKMIQDALNCSKSIQSWFLVHIDPPPSYYISKHYFYLIKI